MKSYTPVLLIVQGLLLLSSCVTSMPSTFIVGGDDAPVSEYPWMASLQVNTAKYGFYHFCGASLVHPRFLLTAGHCVQRGWPDRIILNRHNLKKNSAGSITITNIKAIHKFPGHVGNDKDAALIELAKPIKNIPLLKLNFVDGKHEKAGTMLRVIGWGFLDEKSGSRPDILQEVDAPVKSLAQCQKVMGYKVNSYNICAGYLEGKKDSCGGDSGGPLFHTNPKTGLRTQVGIVSWGKGCARENKLGVYARVSMFSDWIKSFGITDNVVGPVPTKAPTPLPTSKPTGKPTLFPTSKPTAKPTLVPTSKPSAKPTLVPTSKPTALLTLAPTSPSSPASNTTCHIIPGNAGPVKKKVACQLPFTFIHGNGKAVTFDAPATFKEAHAWGYVSRGIDPSSVWCPPKGVRTVDSAKKVNIWEWGVAKCV